MFENITGSPFKNKKKYFLLIAQTIDYEILQNKTYEFNTHIIGSTKEGEHNIINKKFIYVLSHYKLIHRRHWTSTNLSLSFIGQEVCCDQTRHMWPKSTKSFWEKIARRSFQIILNKWNALKCMKLLNITPLFWLHSEFNNFQMQHCKSFNNSLNASQCLGQGIYHLLVEPKWR